MANSPFLPLCVGQIRALANSTIAANPGTSANLTAQVAALDSVTSAQNASSWPNLDLMTVLKKQDNPVSITALCVLQAILAHPANQP